jgi:ribose/xylose/arabinose/galactoside ABC-type transport system permease subunit
VYHGLNLIVGIRDRVSVADVKRKLRGFVERPRELFTEHDVWFILGVLLVLSSAVSPVFLTVNNLFNILRVSSIIGCLAIGQTFVILTGGIDLSVGSVLAVASVMAALGCGGIVGGGTGTSGSVAFIASICCSLYETFGLPFTCLIALLPAGILGFINGILVAKARLPALIVTLAMMGIARGLAFIITVGEPVHIYQGAENYMVLGAGYLGPVPVPVIIWMALAAGCWWFLRTRIIGRHIYAVGGSEETARLSGVNIDRVKLFVYTVSGLFAGAAGIIYTSRVRAGQPTAGIMFELDSIAAVIIGGTSLFGGEGSVIKTVVGMVILGIVINLLNLLNVSMYAQQAVKGGIIVGAVMLRVLRKESS